MSAQLDLFSAPPPAAPPAPIEAPSVAVAPDAVLAADLSALLSSWRVTTSRGLDCAVLRAERWRRAMQHYPALRARWMRLAIAELPMPGVAGETLSQLHRLDIFRVDVTNAGEPVVPLAIVKNAAHRVRRLAAHPKEID